jgi:hypothetical protein
VHFDVYRYTGADTLFRMLKEGNRQPMSQKAAEAKSRDRLEASRE